MTLIFALNGQAQFIEQQKLTASDGRSSDFFGDSLSISGDRLVAGARSDDDNGAGSGSAYVFERQNDGSWQETAKLIASDGAALDQFGDSVSISGDRLVVGVPGDDDQGDRSGSAYVFERQNDGSWQEAAKLTASDGAAIDFFGDSTAISGDYLVVGARTDDDLGENSGSAYVFERQNGGSWQEAAKLTASDGAALDQFGNSVSISGDRLVIGALDDDDAGEGSGSAYVFERQNDGSWQEVAKLTASDGITSDSFGASVSISGDRLVISAFGDDDNGISSGSAYVFERQAGGNWQEAAKLIASDGAFFDFFGGTGDSVSISGDRLVVGASGDDDNGNSAGSAYVFERQAGGNWQEIAKLTASDGADIDFFGDSVSISGDHLLVGAFSANAIDIDSGAAYVFTRSTQPPTAPCDCANATIAGTNGNDRLIGTPGDDIICGFGGNDRLFGEGGQDCLDGGEGNDRLFGGAGNDLLLGRSGSDRLRGDAGNDILNGNANDDMLHGGSGNDILQGSSGNDNLRGDAGMDELSGGSGDDDLRGGSGDDTLHGDGGNDFLRGNDGNDVLRGGTGEDVVDGDQGDDDVRGGSGHDIVKGDAGNDRLEGNGGNDMLRGGSGADDLRGGAGNDDLSGGGNNDIVRGDGGNDVLRGGGGDDDLRGGGDNDIIRGDGGNDVLRGGAGIDMCNGGSGTDTSDDCEETVGIP